MQKILCLLGGLLLIGCSNQAPLNALAEQEQWQEIGIIDGESGHYQRGAIELAKLSALNEKDYANYKMGYLAGIEQYCQPERVFKYGSYGQQYRGECANTANETQSIQQWDEGYDAYVFESTFIFPDVQGNDY